MNCRYGIEKEYVRKKFPIHNDIILDIKFSPGGKYILSGSKDKTLKLWHIKEEACIKTFKGHSAPVLQVAFSTGKYIASADEEGKIKIWDILTGKCIKNNKRSFFQGFGPGFFT